MPALRSLSALTIAACLAQAWAGPTDNAVERRNGGYGGGDGGDYSQAGGWGGDGGWQDQNMNPSDQSKNQDQPPMVVTVTETTMMTVTAPAPVQQNAAPVTITVTAVAPCDANVVTATAYVTTCPMVPAPAASSSSCMPCSAMSWPAVPANAGGLGNCPVWTTSIPNFMPGLSSIPIEQAVVTGAAKAAGPPAGAPSAAPAYGAAPAASGPPAGAPAPAPTYGAPAFSYLAACTLTDMSCRLSLVSAAPLMAGEWSSGGGGMWGVPGAYSASGAGAWTMFLGSTFTTTGTVVPGMGSIPNTMVGAGAAPAPAPSAAPSVLPGVFASGAVAEVPSGTTPTTTTKSSVVSSSSTMTSRPPDTAAVVSAASATPMTARSYGNPGMLGIGKRFMVPRPTAWS